MSPVKPPDPFQIPPEEERCLQIISDYQRKQITLEEAAPRLRDAFKELKGAINLEVSPSVRRLFAEVAKLNGEVFPEDEPDPERHSNGGGGMLQSLQRGWRKVGRHPRISEPLRISFHFAAATERTARAIADWLEKQGQQEVEVESPTEADADDWQIRASSPSTLWSEEIFTRWVDVIVKAPLAGEASFMGWSV